MHRRHARPRPAMLIGAHVSPAGGPANAIARGVRARRRAIQIFNQSPRRGGRRSTRDEEVAAFREALARAVASTRC